MASHSALNGPEIRHFPTFPPAKTSVVYGMKQCCQAEMHFVCETFRIKHLEPTFGGWMRIPKICSFNSHATYLKAKTGDRSGEKILLKANFAGSHSELVVNGRRLRASQTFDRLENPVSFIEIEVYPLENITVSTLLSD
jgi:hypothetical protein